MDERLVSIIIPAHNAEVYCKQCIQTVLIHTTAPYELILVDNGSSDGVAELFDSIPGAKVIHTGQNLGFAGGVNRGIEVASGHPLLLNSDTLVPEGWLDRLRNALLRDDRIGMVGPRSNCVSGVQLISGLQLNSLETINSFSQQLAQENHEKYSPVRRLVGFCMLIRNTALAEVGLFDESYGIGNYEDDDYCIRMLRAGYELHMAEDAFVFHYGSRTFQEMGIADSNWEMLLEKNAALFKNKWQLSPHEQIDSYQQAYILVDKARQALESDDSIGAIRLYKEAIQIAPGYDIPYNDLATVVYNLGDVETAYRYLIRAVTLNPDNEDACSNLQKIGHILNRDQEVMDFLDTHPRSKK